ncbi:MAG: chorismate--pyruvate lyase family protein [Acidimicrobiales bacterium]
MESSSGLARALDRTTGTVTAFLELLVGEPLDAEVRHHLIAEAEASNGLQIDEGHPVLHRSAVLKGRGSGQPYVYAETTVVLSRVSERFHQRLTSSSDPIGRILSEEGIGVTREPLPETSRPTLPLLPQRGESLGGCVLARTYRLRIEGVPSMVISEWFLASLEPFLPAR